MADQNLKMSKKKKWIIGIVAVLVIGFIGSNIESEEEIDKDVTEAEKQAGIDSQQIEHNKKEPSKDEEKVAKEQTLEEEPENDIPEEIADLHLTNVNNDSTDEWQKAVTSENVNMPDNALDYFNTYMDEGDTHYIVSFATNTTIVINDLAGDLYVTITEYESGEEHDANKIGGGMLLMDYVVDKSDESIEEI